VCDGRARTSSFGDIGAWYNDPPALFHGQTAAV
jgi:hypothetical protein